MADDIFGKPNFSEVCARDKDGNPRCPQCGGSQFEAVRSTARKLLWGIGSLLAPADEVRCVTCGAKFNRG